MGRQPFLITIPKLDPGKVKGKKKKKSLQPSLILQISLTHVVLNISQS